jgi:hypothetical protein
MWLWEVVHLDKWGITRTIVSPEGYFDVASAINGYHQQRTGIMYHLGAIESRDILRVSVTYYEGEQPVVSISLTNW